MAKAFTNIKNILTIVKTNFEKWVGMRNLSLSSVINL